MAARTLKSQRPAKCDRDCSRSTKPLTILLGEIKFVSVDFFRQLYPVL